MTESRASGGQYKRKKLQKGLITHVQRPGDILSVNPGGLHFQLLRLRAVYTIVSASRRQDDVLGALPYDWIIRGHG